jgi:limonene-1,2-epoxide hydrolase
MNPSEVVREWVRRFNNQDAAAISELYTKDCINHQIPTGEFKGREKICQMFSDEFSRFHMVCVIENLFEDGEWAILEWKDPKGLRGCGFFQIQHDKIVFQRGYWDKLSFMKEQGA